MYYLCAMELDADRIEVEHFETRGLSREGRLSTAALTLFCLVSKHSTVSI